MARHICPPTGSSGLRTLPRRFFDKFRKGQDMVSVPKPSACGKSDQILRNVFADQLWRVTFVTDNGIQATAEVLVSGNGPRGLIEPLIRRALESQHDITGAKVLHFGMAVCQPAPGYQRLDTLTLEYNARCQLSAARG